MRTRIIQLQPFRQVRSVLLAVAIGSTVTACATIINGSSQSVGFRSQPTGANVYVDGIPMGQTPVAPDLKRMDKHIVRIELDGYEPYEFMIDRSVSGWVAGNILFGGLIGIAIDAATGSMYRLDPSEVDVVLENATIAGDLDSLDLVTD
jgi:hypothetical protein